MSFVARVVREFLIVVTVFSVPFLMGRAVFRLITVGFPDLNIDRSEDAAIGAGALAAVVALLIYLIVSGVRFFRRRDDAAARTGGVGRALGNLVGLFVIGALIDGFSGFLMREAFAPTDAVAREAPAVPPGIDVPPSVPAAAAESAGIETAPTPTDAATIEPTPGIYSCRVGVVVLFFSIRGNNDCGTSDITSGPARDAQCSYNAATRTMQVNDPQSPLYYYEMKFIPKGASGSQSDHNGPGLEVKRATLESPDGTAVRSEWCGLVE